jgi:hypothetical protein
MDRLVNPHESLKPWISRGRMHLGAEASGEAPQGKTAARRPQEAALGDVY